MEQELHTSKTGARPSYEAIENKVGAEPMTVAEAEEKKIDKVAMQGAKRAENRMHNNEERIPGSTIFSK
jgi:hypothetical protein